jgi:ABC-type transport system involved in multi-copper enzyme maturation permease subunit
MHGPVYVLEWLQASRRVQKLPWRSIYAIVLFVEMQWITIRLLDYLVSGNAYMVTYVAEALLYIVSAQQTLLILIATPAFAAGSITDEKRRGTLDFLLTTPLTSGEIILGKWLGQVTPGWILQVLLATLVGEPEQSLLLPIAEQIALIYGLTALAILASVWSASTPRAIVGVYGFLGAVAVVEWLCNAPALGASIWAIPLRATVPERLRLFGVAWLSGLAFVALLIASWRLRPAHERQKNARPNILSRWWDRPPIGATPMRWKERFIGDWMSIFIWSALPAWVRSTIIGGMVAGIGFALPYWQTILILGIAQFVGSGMFVGIRTAGSITSERERQTWDSLLVTPMDARQLVRCKLWGHIDAIHPLMLTYLIPAAVAAWLVEPWCFFGVIYGWLASWLNLYYFGAIGISSSVTATSTWRSILATLIRSVASLSIVQIAVTIVVAFLWFQLMTLMLPAHWQSILIGISLVLAPIPVLLWLFATAEERLEAAEQTLIETEHAGSR